MVNVTITGALVVFVNVPLIFPLPPDAIPVTGTVLSLVQLKVVPETFPDNVIAVMLLPEHIVWLAFVAITLGVGLTKTVAVIAVPLHPFVVGVIVKVTVTGVLVVFVNIPLMFPLPPEAIPVTDEVLSLVQLKVVDNTFPVRVIVAMLVPEHTV